MQKMSAASATDAKVLEDFDPLFKSTPTLQQPKFANSATATATSTATATATAATATAATAITNTTTNSSTATPPSNMALGSAAAELIQVLVRGGSGPGSGRLSLCLVRSRLCDFGLRVILVVGCWLLVVVVTTYSIG